MDCLNLWYSMVKPDSSPTEPYSDSHWHGEKIKSSLHRWSAWSTQSDHNLLVRRLPRLAETLKTPETLATPLADRGLGTCIGRGPAAWHAPHAPCLEGAEWSGRESSSGSESMASSLCQLTSAYVSFTSAYVSLCQLCQCRFHDPENKHLTNQKTSTSMPQYAAVCRSMPEDVHTAAPQKTHSQCHCPKAPARTSSCSRWKPQVGQAQQTDQTEQMSQHVPTCPTSNGSHIHIKP